MNYNEALFDFIEKGVTAYQNSDNISGILSSNGFAELQEGEAWNLQAGKSYFIRRNLSSVLAFKIPSAEPKSFMITASHLDSPCLKIKENGELLAEGCYTKLNVELYGSALLASWFDRPLSVAGRVLTCENGAITVHSVNIKKDLLMLPSLCNHFNPNANTGYAYSVQKDMLPTIGNSMSMGKLTELIADEIGVSPEAIIGKDLYVYCRQKPCLWGMNREYIASPRLDDLQCAFADLQGFLAGGHPNTITVYAAFDNEEIGSGSKQGGASSLLRDILRRVYRNLGQNDEAFEMALASSMLLSTDNGHAVHPNHGEKSDINNRPKMNDGVLIKLNARNRYTTDGISASIVREICRRAGVPTQEFINHSDIKGGSTLGHLAATMLPINMADIGLAQLAMHSTYETAGALDTEYMVRAMTEFYNTMLVQPKNGLFILNKA